MRRMNEVVAALALALVMPLESVLAQSQMTFRPLPPESAAVLDSRSRDDMRREVRRAMEEARAAARSSGVEVAIDSSENGVTISIGDDGITPPDAPEPPTPPTLSTTGDITRFGVDITIEAGQRVQGDVVAIGGDVLISGKVEGSVTAIGGDVRLEPGARVDEDVVCLGGTLREEPGSSVGGQRVTAPRSPGARFVWPMLAAVGTGFQIIGHVVSALFLFGIAWLILKIAPGRSQRSLDLVRREPGTTFAVGLLVWGMIIPSVIVLALVVALLCITIIGIPLAAAVALGYVAFFVIAALWGSVVGYTVIGHTLHERFRGPTPSLVAAALFGVLALQGMRVAADLLNIIPLFGFVGGLVKFVFAVTSIVLCTFGAGALVLGEYRNRTVQEWWGRFRPMPDRSIRPGPPSAPPPSDPAPPAVSS